MIVLPKRKLLRAAIPLVLAAPLILPITAVKGKELGMFMPFMGTAAQSGKYTAPPSSVPIYKGTCIKSTSTPSGTPITFTGKDIGTAHDQRIFVAGWAITDALNNTITVGGTTLDYMIYENTSGSNILMAWMALPSSYGTTTTIEHIPNGTQASFQLVYWIAYPNVATPLIMATAEASTSTAASISPAMTTQNGGFALFTGMATAATGLTGTKTGTGTYTENGEDSSARSISAMMVTDCDSAGITVSLQRDIGGSGYKAIAGMTWGRCY